jgi:prepilin-type N-terminal cleavage/methylation domain-containing protein
MIGSQRGFTLLELMVAVAVLAITLGFVISSFSGTINNQRLQASAENMYDALLNARTQALSRNAKMYVDVNTGASWCYGIIEGTTDAATACDCATANECIVDNLENVASVESYRDITLTSADLTALVYDPRMGMPQTTLGTTISTSKFTFTNTDGNSLSVVLNPVGRLSLCSSNGFKGYSAC